MAKNSKPTTKSSKSEAVPTYKPSLYLDNNKPLGKHQVGQKVKVVVEGVVTGQSMNKDYVDPKKVNHSTSIEIHKVREHKPPVKKK